MGFFTEYYGFFLSGTKITIITSFFTLILGLVLGVLLVMMKISKFKILRKVATAYVEFIRGTPSLVQLYIIFYGLAVIGIRFPEIEVFGTDLSRLLSGIFALSINASAYICEIIRSGINSISKGQMEASRSLGFNYLRSMQFIVLPQAFKNILPTLGNEFIVIIKESAIISIIGIPELMYKADTLRGITYKPFLPLIVAAIIYFILTNLTSRLLKRLENRLNRAC